MKLNFVPELFISIGATSAYYTLRETYLHERFIPGEGAFGNSVMNGVYQGTVSYEVRSFHHQNLSQDLDEAIGKAGYLAAQMGLELKVDRAELEREMRDIKRANAEEMERRQRAQQEREQAWELERTARKNAQLEQIKNGIFPIGRYEDKLFEDAPVSYIEWLLESRETFEQGTVIRALADEMQVRYGHRRLPKPNATATVGQPGQRLEADVTVIRVGRYERTVFGFGGSTETVYITTMVTDGGVCVVCKSPKFARDVGYKMKIHATVKEHSEYKGQMQTVVQRIKEI